MRFCRPPWIPFTCVGWLLGLGILGPAQAVGQRATVQVAVRTNRGEPVADSLVIPLALDPARPLLAQTAAPISGIAELGEAVLPSPSGPDSPRLMYGYTARDGCLNFTLPAGRYRLIAARFLAATGPLGPLELAGDVVQLDGASKPLQLAANETIAVELRPLGSAEWQIESSIPNSDAYLIVSQAPLAADPILGFAGWDVRFLNDLLLAVRLPRGVCRIQGLPRGEVHAGLFANDNNPGFGSATAQLADTPVRSQIPLVASWSDGHKQPPERLRPLVEKLRAEPEALRTVQTRWMAILEDTPADPASGPLGMYQQLQQHLADRVPLDANTEVSLGDAVAALLYVRLADQDRR